MRKLQEHGISPHPTVGNTVSVWLRHGRCASDDDCHAPRNGWCAHSLVKSGECREGKISRQRPSASWPGCGRVTRVRMRASGTFHLELHLRSSQIILSGNKLR